MHFGNSLSCFVVQLYWELSVLLLVHWYASHVTSHVTGHVTSHVTCHVLSHVISHLFPLQFLKYVNFREISSLEFVMWFIFGFGPYFIAEGLNLSGGCGLTFDLAQSMYRVQCMHTLSLSLSLSLSGIMAVLFSGIVMSHYTHFNLSPVTQVTVQQTMRTVAFIAGI